MNIETGQCLATWQEKQYKLGAVKAREPLGIETAQNEGGDDPKVEIRQLEPVVEPPAR